MITTLIIVAAVAILIILLATASYKVCPADRVMVITGPGGRRFVSGGSAFIIPFIMRVDWLSLGAVQSLLRTDTPIPTKDAILIDVNAVANFQIASETMTVDENGKQVKALENAAKNYLNQSKERMEKDVTQVLLGKLREVIGKTELKELMENRDTFAATVAESARVDMERLGLQLTTFNIQDFTDRQNVIANMGAEMAAEISRNAKPASINAEQDVAVRQNQLDLKRAELQSISDKAQAEADAVKGITAAEQSKTLKVKEQEAEIAAAEKKAVLEQKNAEIEEQKLNAMFRPSRIRCCTAVDKALISSMEPDCTSSNVIRIPCLDSFILSRRLPTAWRSVKERSSLRSSSILPKLSSRFPMLPVNPTLGMS